LSAKKKLKSKKKKKNFFDAADNLDAGSDEKQSFHFWGGLRQILSVQ